MLRSAGYGGIALKYLLFISFICGCLGITKDNLKTFNCDSNVEQLLWTTEYEALIVRNNRSSIILDKNLVEVQAAEKGKSTYFTDCPLSDVECTIQGSFNKGSFSSISVIYSQSVVDCSSGRKIWCKTHGSETPSAPELVVRHSANAKCVKSFEPKRQLTNNVLRQNVFHPLVKLVKDNRPVEFTNLWLAYKTGKDGNDRIYYIASEHADFKVIYGFTHNGFRYVIMVESPRETVLLRVCDNQDMMFSYTKLYIDCPVGNNQVYSSASSAYLYKHSEHSLAETNAGTKHDLLYMTFTNVDGKSGNNLESVVCFYPMDFVDFMMADNVNNRHSESSSFGVKNEDLKGTMGTIHGENLVSFSKLGSSLAVTLQNQNMVAFVGTTQGELFKFYLERNGFSLHLYNVSLEHVIGSNDTTSRLKIHRSNTLDNAKENLFLIIGRTIVKFPIKSCTPYQDSEKCIRSTLGCGWCGTRCTMKEDCRGKFAVKRKDLFEPPSVILEGPLNGPLQGGTTLSLSGTAPGYEVKNHQDQVRFQVGERVCEVTKWSQQVETLDKAWKAECRTGEHLKEWTAEVILEISELYQPGTTSRVSSNEKFSFLIPQFFGISPGYGPKWGGTNVTLFGKNMDIGSAQSVYLFRRECFITSNNGRRIFCMTSYSPSEGTGSLTLWIDDNAIKPSLPSGMGLEGTFQYRVNPVVDLIIPESTCISGHKNISLLGRHLDSVSNPKLVVEVKIKGETITFNGSCSQKDFSGMELSCETPSLASLNSSFIPTAKNPVEASIRLHVDGKLNGDSTSQEIKLYYYPDFTFYNLTEELLLEDQDVTREIHLKGENLNLTLSAQEVDVSVNDTESCEIKSLGSSNIHCQLQEESVSRLKRHSDASYPILVSVGNLHLSVGKISVRKLESTRAREEDWRKRILVPVVMVLGAVVLCILIFIIYRHCHKQSVAGDYEAALQAQEVTENRSTHSSDDPMKDEMLHLQFPTEEPNEEKQNRF